MNIKNLTEFRRMLSNLTDDEVDMTAYATDDKVPKRCALGWMLLDPYFKKLGVHPAYKSSPMPAIKDKSGTVRWGSGAAAYLFDLDYNLCVALFSHTNPNLAPSRSEVITVIDHILNGGNIETYRKSTAFQLEGHSH